MGTEGETPGCAGGALRSRGRRPRWEDARRSWRARYSGQGERFARRVGGRRRGFSGLLGGESGGPLAAAAAGSVRVAEEGGRE